MQQTSHPPIYLTNYRTSSVSWAEVFMKSGTANGPRLKKTLNPTAKICDVNRTAIPVVTHAGGAPSPKEP